MNPEDYHPANEWQMRTAIVKGDSRHPQKLPWWVPVVMFLVLIVGVAGFVVTIYE